MIGIFKNSGIFRRGWLVAAACCLFFCGCGVNKTQSDKKAEAIPVKVTTVQTKDLEKTLDYVGNIKAKEEAGVYPKVSGKVIEKVKEEGSPVNKGDVILFIDRDEVGFTFEKAPVESPLAGIVGRISVDIGSYVDPSTQVAFVVNMEKMEIGLEIPERYLPAVALGQEAKISVDAYPDRVFIGRVTLMSPVLDLETRSAPVEITIDNKEGHLKSGMFAKVKLVIAEHKGVPVILKEALMGKGDNLYVYVVEDHKASMRTVKAGIRYGELVEIREGVKGGDIVVVMGQQRLHDGVSVETEELK
ncbi:MAG: efflux RND transporter periplasmic adaptor subunit [Candidatus Omnitrophica bacterium]|nr:efflux RND transporter periplasmic adaptor subunit [Candidatus Omnitrophota bacterium]MDD5573830.1 efflux RND transporter periplasmic adaptor subunit [Candidatus Omnitrophota bacterium]